MKALFFPAECSRSSFINVRDRDGCDHIPLSKEDLAVEDFFDGITPMTKSFRDFPFGFPVPLESAFILFFVKSVSVYSTGETFIKHLFSFVRKSNESASQS
jgi:hypothetical protein